MRTTEQLLTNKSILNDAESMTTEAIKFLKGIFQGDSLSVLLFIISLNPLSFMLKKIKGYSIGEKREIHHAHNNFVDDLKLFAETCSSIQKQLDIITTVGEKKCVYMPIEKGKMVNSSNPTLMNDLIIKPILSGYNYCYLGIGENITYSGPINKTRVLKEYLNLTRKI